MFCKKKIKNSLYCSDRSMEVKLQNLLLLLFNPDALKS